MGFIDAIKGFFQDMYNSISDFFLSMFENVTSFFSSVYDMFLFLIIFVLGIAVFMVLKRLTVPVIITGQIIMLSASITLMLSFVALLATSFVSVYNKIYSLAGFITSGSDVSCLGSMMTCLSINGVLSTFFTEIFALFVLVFLIKISSLFLWAFDFISDKVWRIGVLIGLV